MEKENITIDVLINDLNNRANIVYKHNWLFSEQTLRLGDYGTGELITMVEVHTLTSIAKNEGITISELAKINNRTKGAISQLIKKLEKRGLIFKNKKENNGKNVHLFLTERGRVTSLSHEAYDRMEVTHITNELLKYCTMEEINHFYKVMEYRNRIMEHNLEK